MKMKISNYENGLKGIMQIERACEDASKASESLEEKLRFQKAQKAAQSAIRELRLHYYDFVDAVAIQSKMRDLIHEIEVWP